MKRTVAFVALAAAALSAQAPTRRATNIPSLLAYPGFYHTRPIVIVGKVATQDTGAVRVSDDDGVGVRVVYKGSAPDGLDEIRGEFWDIGRMKPDEPRLTRYDLKRTFNVDPDAPWPRPGEVTAIVAEAITPAQLPAAPGIRALVLFPTRYLDQKVTVTGQFAGRNLFGDLPDAPAKSRYDFVIRSADAAVWVSGVQPRGKAFNLSLDARIDTGHWLDVTGVVRQGRGLQWLEAGPDSVQLGKPPTETAAAEPERIRVPAAPPPEVVFSAPTEEESDVAPTTTVRVQFSRDLDPATIKGHVHVRYADRATPIPGEVAPAAPEFTTQYVGANRELELRFKTPLERFRTVIIELTNEIIGTDQQPLKPYVLKFDVGGS